MVRIAVLGLMVALGGCATEPTGATRPMAGLPASQPGLMTDPGSASGVFDVANLPPVLEGIWRSNGYGMTVVIEAGEIEVYNTAGDLCMVAGDDEAASLAYLDHYTLSQGGQRLSLRTSLEAHTYQWTQVAELPQACQAPPRNTPHGNFEAFAAFMGAHYAFFDLHAVDWPQRVAQARAQVRDDMGQTELFDLMAGMLEGIEDGHLSLAGDVDRQPRIFEANDGRTQKAMDAGAVARGEDVQEVRRAWRRGYWMDNIGQILLAGQGTAIGHNRFQYGVIEGDIGYIALLTVGGYVEADFSDPQSDLEFVDAAMDAALAQFEAAGVKGVIIDLSINFGGHDSVGRRIASFFAAADTRVYDKSPYDADTPYTTEVWMQPSTGRRFTGPVYVLTSDVTVSAGETLTLALRALPNVTHAGAATRGALSDILPKSLPNGWVLTMSNEVYRDAKGVQWEGPGISPQLPLQVFGQAGELSSHLAAVRGVAERLRAGE